jgi:hypothetical protein
MATGVERIVADTDKTYGDAEWPATFLRVARHPDIVVAERPILRSYRAVVCPERVRLHTR